MKTRKFSLFSAFLLLGALSAAQAATWRVDAAQADAGAFASLQEALDRAADGDVVLVADGDYEPIALAASRAVAIRSENGPEKTFITGDGSGRCATFTEEDGEPIPLATLEGFTLRGGADSSEEGGGGAFGGRLVRCILRENAAFRGGGASCAILENCLLTANAADLAGGGAVSSELVNCTVAGNRAGGTGGGTAECDLANSIVQGNESPDGADAVAAFAVHSCTAPLLPGEGNTAADARFADPAKGDWSLAADSPCLDAGKAGFGTASRDLAGNARAVGKGIDMGAYERPGSSAGAAAKAAGEVTVAFDPNGGSCTVKRKTFRVGGTYTGLPRASRSGHRFLGWFAAPSGGGSRLTNTSVVTASRKKLYARWTRKVWVEFDPTGGTCSPTRKTYVLGTKFGSAPVPVRSKSIFLGWYTAPTGGSRLRASTIVTLSRTKFYAQWAPAVVVTFDPAGGTCSPARRRYRQGKPYGSFPVPVRPGCIFDGWFTPAGQRIREDAIARAIRPRLVAHWTKAYTVHPVGDSMTYGIRTRTNPLNPRGNSPSVVAKISNQGWRGYLNRSLLPWAQARGSTVIFRGTHGESEYAGNVPHDGFPGETASAYASRHKAAIAVEADIQIVFLGMNDAISISLKGGNYGGYFSSTKSGLAQVLSALGAGNGTPMTIVITEPKVTTLVSERNSAYSASAINSVIAGYINPYVRSRAGSKVKILDIENLFSNRSYTDDGFHLSVSGNQAIATRLDSLIESFWP